MLSLYCVHAAILPFILATKNLSNLDLNVGPEASMINSLLECPWGPSCFQSHSIKAGCLSSLILEESGPRLPTTSSWFQVQEPETSFQGAQKGFINGPLAHSLVISLYLLITIAFILLLFQGSGDSSLVTYQMPWDCYFTWNIFLKHWFSWSCLAPSPQAFILICSHFTILALQLHIPDARISGGMSHTCTRASKFLGKRTLPCIFTEGFCEPRSPWCHHLAGAHLFLHNSLSIPARRMNVVIHRLNFSQLRSMACIIQETLRPCPDPVYCFRSSYWHTEK